MPQLISNLPVHSLVKFGNYSVGTESPQPIVWRIIDKNHSGYPSNSVTLITDKVIDILVYDAAEPNMTIGGGDYAQSNINQWLNSVGAANNWYTNAHSGDAAPSYKSRPGFLYNFTEDERLAILTTTLSMIIEPNNTPKSVVAKVFIPSAMEILGTYRYNDGGVRFTGFSSYDTKAYLTSQAFTNSTSSGKPSSIDTAVSYLTRTTDYSNLYYTTRITATGTYKGSVSPNEAGGVRPCLNLSSTIKVSDTPDSNGYYTVYPNSAPTISVSNGDLGTKKEGFTLPYVVNDINNEPVTVKEYIDNIQIRSYVATLGGTNTIYMTDKSWLKLTNGVHTIKIVATDGVLETIRTVTFTKSINSLIVQRTTPIVSSTKPKSIIATVVKNIPVEATFKVEACINGFDDKPTWEDITFEVVNGEVHDFNPETTKTSAQWGVNIRVTVNRNGGEGACYITEIGGNFE